MKRAINTSILLIVFVLSLVSQFAFAETTGGANLGGILISDQTLYTPYPAEPGKYIDLWVRIQNVASSTTDEVTCALDPVFPFSVEAGEDSEKIVGTLGANQEALLKFHVRINADAVQGTNYLKFKCKYKNTDWTSSKFAIYIQPHDASISVGRVESNPVEFEPGQIGQMSIELENIASIALKDITVKLDLSSADIPFVPVNSTIEKRIQRIAVGGKQTVVFDIATSADAQSKRYKIPLKLTYNDDLGNNYSKETIVSLTVASKPNIMTVYEKTGLIKNEAKNAVTLSIINKGLSQVKFMTAKLDPSGGYTLLSPADVYIGNINSDDSETAEFDLYINTTASKISLPLIVTYRDISERTYTEKFIVSVDVYTKELAIKYGLEKQTSVDPVLIAILGLAGLYIIYKLIRFLFRKK